MIDKPIEDIYGSSRRMALTSTIPIRKATLCSWTESNEIEYDKNS